MILRNNKKAFTLVELLTVMGIIALLVGIAIPSLSAAKKYAKESACRATINTMEQSLFNFQKDHGAYPSSTPSARNNITELDMNPSPVVNLGAHKLAEALFGYDRLGYQKDHFYRIGDNIAVPETYGRPLDSSGRITTRTAYMPTDKLELTTLPELKALKGYTPNGTAWASLGNSYSYADCWNNQNPIITDGLKGDESLPFLYFKANTRGTQITSRASATGYVVNDIFHFSDNQGISQTISPNWMPGATKTDEFNDFQFYMWNANTGTTGGPLRPCETASARPHKADSFVIISAGFDQVYGTKDDICNFDFKAGK